MEVDVGMGVGRQVDWWVGMDVHAYAILCLSEDAVVRQVYSTSTLYTV